MREYHEGMIGSARLDTSGTCVTFGRDFDSANVFFHENKDTFLSVSTSAT
jgi:hypothetical protein